VRLFEDKTRPLRDPKKQAEHDFTYLERSGRPAAARVRAFLEECFARLGNEHQVALAPRLPCEGYAAAAFELIVHELCHRRGRSLNIQPPKSGTRKRPDFLVTAPPPSFYLEAVLANEQSAPQAATATRLKQLHDLLDGLDSPEFFIEVEVESYGPGQPSARDIRGFLSTMLAGLDPDDESIWNSADESDSGPAWQWHDQGWALIFRPWPKSTALRAKPGQRPIGALLSPTREVHTAEAIRDAIAKKASRYGQMDRPYVVAVNVFSFPLEDIDITDALFGDVVMAAQETSEGIREWKERLPNGTWGSPAKPQHTRVSAALLFDGVDPWNVGHRRAVLVHNPWARYPLAPGQFGTAEWSLRSGHLEKTEGQTLLQVFGLDPGWPMGPDDLLGE
jgi:hypothetical protein